MSEKIYALLLRLYPSHFRVSYGEAALQLFRDRARDEKGFFPTVRLWLDLLADLAISVPREYRHVPQALLAASASQRLGGAFLFRSGRRVATSRSVFFRRRADAACCRGVLDRNQSRRKLRRKSRYLVRGASVASSQFKPRRGHVEPFRIALARNVGASWYLSAAGLADEAGGCGPCHEQCGGRGHEAGYCAAAT